MTRDQWQRVNTAFQATLAASASMRSVAEQLYLQRLRRALREEHDDLDSVQRD